MKARLIAMTTIQPFVLYRHRPDGTEERVSTYPDFGSGWSAGQRAVHEDRDHAYALYTNGQRVARFCYSRLTTRTPVSNLDALAMIGSLS